VETPKVRSSIRVCLVGPSLEILGGQAVQMERLRSHLATVPGLEVSVIHVNPRLPGALRAMQRVKYLRTVVNTVAYLLTLLWRVPRVDVVHAFSASYWSFLLAPVPAMLVGRLLGKGVLLNYRSGEADDHLTHWRTAKWGARLAHAIIVPSGYLVEVFGRHGLGAEAIENFVDPDRIPFRARGQLAPRFLSNRNLEALYNVPCTVQAFARIQEQVPDASLVIAGDGTQADVLRREVATLGLQHVRFAGRVPPQEMPAYYAAADVYLNSPDIDNMPNSIIEAFAAGVPVVTTNAGGIPFIVRHGENGLMTETGDAAGLARESLRLLREPGLATRLSACARDEVLDRYTWHAVRARWRSLYERLAGRDGLA
jgi:glycosyltransferase involved in cell wall biosynthesis